MNKRERNEKAKQFILDKLDLVSELKEKDFKDLLDDQKLKSTLKDLICVNAKGFRGIVATAITGKFLDREYDPLNNFYSCNPRSIFEQGIYYAFGERGIPCGKSDPLNVAKNVNILDDEWAKGKRPEKSAKAVIDFLSRIESESDCKRKQKIINFFFYKLLEYAKNKSSFKIEIPEEEQISNQEFANKLSKLVIEYPESGTVPQFVIFKLLTKLYDNTETIVKGGDDSVFSTNTTAKKPADIWLTSNEQIFNLYEITIKKIDKKRLDDCLQSLDDLNVLDKPVHFICRLPEDIKTLEKYKEGALIYKEKTFNFIDITIFIQVISSLLSREQIKNLLVELKTFIEDIKISMKTKKGWNEIFGND